MAAVRADLESRFEGLTGKACIGRANHFPHGPDGEYVKRADWRQDFFEYPAEKRKMYAHIEKYALEHWDMFASSVTFPDEIRGDGLSLPSSILKFEYDAPTPDGLDLLRTLGARLHRSGRDGHVHVYLLMDRLLTPVEVKAYSLRLARACGITNSDGGGKWGDSEQTRIRGTWNHKPEAMRMVAMDKDGRSFLGRPVSVERFNKVLPESSNHVVKHDDSSPALLVAERVTRTRLRGGGERATIRSMMREGDPGDGTERFKRTKLLVRLCNEAGFTQNETLWILEQHEPSVEKFGKRLAGQVIACWDQDTRPTPAGAIEVLGDDGDSEDDDELYNPDLSLADQLRRLGTWNYDSLMGAEFKELNWPIDEFIAEGLTLIAAAPKIGKSYLMLNIVVSMAWGLGEALGNMSAQEGAALIISVDDPSPRRMQNRLNEVTTAMNLSPRDRRHPITIMEKWPYVGEGGGELLDAYLSEHQECRLVVIDTLDQIRVDGKANATPGKADQKVMKELKGIADKHGVAIIVIAHDRKNKDSADFLDAVSGHRKITGGADTVLFLNRVRGKNEVKCSITGRDVLERDEHFQLEFPLWVHEAIDEVGEVVMTVEDYVLQFLRDHPNGGLAKSIVKEYPELNEAGVRQALTRLKDARRIKQPNGLRTPYVLP
ncbi:hypothetical protein A2J01_25820 [Rhodococcus sp. EPR-134]|nr:hypothetical protein A2J01_25820 [Rhodococcus sp. EPR-134]